MIGLVAILLSQGITLRDEGTNQGQITTLNCTGTGVTCTRSGPAGAGIGRLQVTAVQADGGAFAGAGATFITQTPSSDLSAEQAMSLLGTGLVKNTTTTGVQSIYTGTSCTNQFPRSLDTAGAAACASVSLTADVSGTLPENSGGTGTTALTCAAGQTLTSNGTLYSCAYPGLSTETSMTLTNGAGWFTTTVTGATWVTTSSKITCEVLGTTADNLTPETITAAQLQVTIANRVLATGFDLQVFNPNGLDGVIRVHCIGTST